MKAFRVGFIATLSFFIIIGIFSATLGFYSAPVGPKMPEYPRMDYTQPTNNGTDGVSDYQKKMDKYNADYKKYQEDQKNFTKDKIVPYARNVLVGWILAIAIIEIIGLVVSTSGFQLVGGGWAFSGLWTIFLGPIGGIIWYLNVLVSAFARQAEKDFSSEPILQAVAVACFISVVLLSAVGVFLEKTKRPFIS